MHRAARYVLHPDVSRAEGRELGAHGRPQVDPRFVSCGARHHPSSAGCARYRLRYASVDFEAAGSDAGADGREHGSAAEVLDGCLDDAGHDSAPPGVDGDDVSARRVGHEDWNAVGHAYADCDRVPGSCATIASASVSGLGSAASLASIVRLPCTCFTCTTRETANAFAIASGSALRSANP